MSRDTIYVNGKKTLGLVCSMRVLENIDMFILLQRFIAARYKSKKVAERF